MVGKILQKAGTDGLAHIIASAFILLVAQIFLPIWLAVAVTEAIGIAKELIWDCAMKKGTSQWKDILCDNIGIAMGCLAYLPAR